MVKATAVSTRPFGEALTDLVADHDEFTTSMGTPNMAAFAEALDGLGYDTLRKILSGAREVKPEHMEACARALRIDPSYFAEYRLHRARSLYDPNVVGLERALETLAALG